MVGRTIAFVLASGVCLGGGFAISNIQSNKKIDTLNNTIIEQREENADLRNSLNETTASKILLESKHAENETEITSLNDQLEKAFNGQKVLQQEIAELTDIKTALELDIETLNSEITTLKTQLETSEINNEELQAQLTEKETLLNQAQAELETANNTITEKENKITELNTTITNLNTQITELQAENASLKAYILELEQEIEDLKTPVISTFTIDGTSYSYQEGMTWEEWVASEYNTLGLIVSDDNAIITTADGSRELGILSVEMTTRMYASDTITAEVYTLIILVSTEIISFNFIDLGADSHSYQAEEGMTWGDWVDGGYDTGNFVFSVDDSGYVKVNTIFDTATLYPVYINSVKVMSNDVIIADGNYAQGNPEPIQTINFRLYTPEGYFDYQAEEGMTWGEFVESEYNNNEFFVLSKSESNYITSKYNTYLTTTDEEGLPTTNVYLTISDVIENGVTYGLTSTAPIQIITFTIDDENDYIVGVTSTVYQAEKGMTWQEWINSEYNTSGYSLNVEGANGYIAILLTEGSQAGLPCGVLNNEFSSFPITDEIIEGHVYKTTMLI